MRKVNILIYCKTRIRKRRRKQYILGITLQPLNRRKKNKNNILQLNFEPVVFRSPYLFLPLTKPLLSGARKTFKQT